jgi:hypothetical protein
MIEEDNIDFGYADGSIGCSLPDLRYILALIAGAAVVAAALVIATVRKMRGEYNDRIS